MIYTDFGLTVRYNGLELAEVSVPDSFKDKICGICGNYDGIAYPDNEISDVNKQPVRYNAFVLYVLLYTFVHVYT